MTSYLNVLLSKLYLEAFWSLTGHSPIMKLKVAENFQVQKTFQWGECTNILAETIDKFDLNTPSRFTNKTTWMDMSPFKENVTINKIKAGFRMLSVVFAGCQA